MGSRASKDSSPLIARIYENVLQDILSVIHISYKTSYTGEFDPLICGKVSNWVTYKAMDVSTKESSHSPRPLSGSDQLKNEFISGNINEDKNLVQEYEGDRWRMTRYFWPQDQKNESEQGNSLSSEIQHTMNTKVTHQENDSYNIHGRYFFFSYDREKGRTCLLPCDICSIEYGDMHPTLSNEMSQIDPVFATEEQICEIALNQTNISPNDSLDIKKCYSCSFNPIQNSHQSTSFFKPVQIPIYGNEKNHKPFLEPDVLDFFLPFILDTSLLQCLCVCPHWFVTIYQHLHARMEPIIQAFKLAYSPKQFEFLNSTLSIQPLFTASNHVVRIDLLLYCKVLPECLNKCTQFGYSFSYFSPEPTIQNLKEAEKEHSTKETSSSFDDVMDSFNKENNFIPENKPFQNRMCTPQGVLPPCRSTFGENKKKEYQTQFRFETLKQNSRRKIWIHRDVCRFHGDELMVASLANVPTVNVNDRLEIPVNISNAFGLVNLNSITWKSSTSIASPEREVGQTCEALRHYNQWFSLDRFQKFTNERLEINDFFGPQWTHLKTEYTGVDVTCSRSTYLASQIGEVPQCRRWFGIQSIVLPRDSPIICPLTRLGLQHDRFASQLVRQGDIIVLYILQGGTIPP